MFSKKELKYFENIYSDKVEKKSTMADEGLNHSFFEEKSNNSILFEKEKKNKKPKKKRKRRLKKSEEPRKYICGCHKTYFSYAALYTHTKLKHKGIYPEGTNTIKKKKVNKRKRDDFNKIDKLDSIANFNKKFVGFIKEFDLEVKERVFKSSELINNFPCEIFVKEKFFFKILVNLEILRKEMRNYKEDFENELEIIFMEIYNLVKLNCYQIFSLFIIYIFRFISFEFFPDIVFIFVGFSELLNSRAFEKYELLDLKVGLENINFCDVKGAEFIPDYFNSFIFEFLEKSFEENFILKNPKDLKFFSVKGIGLVRIVKFLKFFGEWLNIFRLSTAKVEIPNIL